MKTKKVKFKNQKNQKNIKNIQKKQLTKKLKKIFKEKLKIKLKPIIDKHIKNYTKKLAQRNKKFRKSKKKIIQKGGGFADDLSNSFNAAVIAADTFYATSFLSNIAGVVAELAVLPATAESAEAALGGTAEYAAGMAIPPPGEPPAEGEDVAEALACGGADAIGGVAKGAGLTTFGAVALGAAAGGTLDAVIGHDQSRSSATNMYLNNKKETNESAATANDNANSSQVPPKGQPAASYPTNNSPGSPFVPSPTPNPYN
jgi:hypothetical protein